MIGRPLTVISDLKLEKRFKVSIDTSLALSLSLSLSPSGCRKYEAKLTGIDATAAK